jgi:transposase
MQSISTIGLDIAKSVFQVHGIDAAGQLVLRRQLRRRYVLAFFQKLSSCLVEVERHPSRFRNLTRRLDELLRCISKSISATLSVATRRQYAPMKVG